MDNFSSYAIINIKLLEHETKNLHRVYSSFEKLMFTEQDMLECFWTTKHLGSEMRIKFYFANSNKLNKLFEHQLFNRFIKLIEKYFSLKPNILIQESSTTKIQAS